MRRFERFREASGLSTKLPAEQVKFLGQIINSSGIRPDIEKLRAVMDMPEPTDVSGVRRFLGMVNQLGKFTPHLAEITKPMRDLLSKTNDWVWGQDQQSCFQALKDSLTSTPVLALYDAKRETTVSADASSFGLGAVILQRQPDGELKSRRLRLEGHDGGRAAIRTDREGSPRHDLGLREIQRLHTR